MMATNVIHLLIFVFVDFQARSAESPMDFEWTNPQKSSFTFDPSFTRSLHTLETPTKKRMSLVSYSSNNQAHSMPPTVLQNL